MRRNPIRVEPADGLEVGTETRIPAPPPRRRRCGCDEHPAKDIGGLLGPADPHGQGLKESPRGRGDSLERSRLDLVVVANDDAAAVANG